MNRCLKIGVTGSIGMGKSAVSSHFRALGFPVFDADSCVHKLYDVQGKAVSPVSQLVPEALINGYICRKSLSGVVLNNPTMLKSLEDIMHPLVQEERLAFYLKAARENQLCVIFDIPLLIEGILNDSANSLPMDYIVVATANAQLQEMRVLKRPNMSKEKFNTILSKQVPDEVKRKHAHYLVHTDIGEDYSAAKSQVASIMEDIISKNSEVWKNWLAGKHFSFTANSSLPVIDTVVFDLDDTLVDFSPIMVDAMDALITFVMQEMPQTFHHASTGSIENVGANGNDRLIFANSLKQACDRVRVANPLVSHNVFEVRRLGLMELAQLHGESMHVSNAMEVFVRARTLGVIHHIYPDTISCLQYLKHHKINDQGDGYRIGIMTNGYMDFDLLSAHLPEFTKLVDFYVQAADCGAQKPSCVPFISVIHKASSSYFQSQNPNEKPEMHPPYDPKKILFVGDSYSKDVLGARNAGMKGVWLVRPVNTSVNGQSYSAQYHDEYHAQSHLIDEAKLSSLDPEEVSAYLSQLSSK